MPIIEAPISPFVVDIRLLGPRAPIPEPSELLFDPNEPYSLLIFDVDGRLPPALGGRLAGDVQALLHRDALLLGSRGEQKSGGRAHGGGKTIQAELDGRMVTVELPRRYSEETCAVLPEIPNRLKGDILDFLPARGPIRDYVEYAAPLTHAPIYGHLAAALSFASYGAARLNYHTQSLALVVHRGAAKPILEKEIGLWLWFVMADPSGRGKTTAIHQLKDVASEACRQAMITDPFVSLGSTAERFIHDILDRFDSERDVTPGLLTHDEFSKVLERDTWVDYLSQAYDGKEIANRTMREKRDASQEKRDKKETVRHPRFSMIVSSTEAGLAARFTKHSAAGGLGARLIWVPTSKVTLEDLQSMQLTDRDGERAMVERWRGWLAGDLPMLAAEHQDSSGPTIIWKADAAQLMHEFFHENEAEFGVEEDPTIGSIARRVVNTAKRIAAVYALQRSSRFVELEDAEPAKRFAQACARYGAGVVPKLTLNPLEAKMARLRQRLDEAGMEGLPKKRVYAILGGATSQMEADMILRTLDDSIGLCCRRRASGGRGRPALHYWLEKHAPMRTENETTMDLQQNKPTVDAVEMAAMRKQVLKKPS